MKYKKNIMRELKDYFCNYEQAQELFKLGIKFDSLAYYFNHEGKNYFASSMDYFENKDLVAPLRSQALDYFRELGYTLQIRANEHGHWYEVEKNWVTRTQGQWHTYEVSENELISRLIELEKEARNER